jgi:GAF domain-containing protein
VLREYGFASIMSVAASAILGYRLARMQLFNPLRMQMAQLAALRDVSHALIDTQDVQQVLDAVVQQSRRMLNTDLALITIRDEEADEPMLVVGAQDGGSINVVGRKLAQGTGLSGRAFVTKQTLRVHNYHAWEGQSPTFADLPVHATLSVPLLYDDEVIGVLTVGELKPGRIFSDREQAMLEMLAPQAAVALMNARLRLRIAALEHVST